MFRDNCHHIRHTILCSLYIDQNRNLYSRLNRSFCIHQNKLHHILRNKSLYIRLYTLMYMCCYNHYKSLSQNQNMNQSKNQSKKKSIPPRN